MENKLKNYGYREEPLKEGQDYIFGGLTKGVSPVINESADWRKWLPEDEVQVINGADTYACATFGTLNVLEILSSFWELPRNWSDRFLAIASGTKPGIGNSPHTVAETFRHMGCCFETSLPISQARSIEEFYTPDPLPENLKEEAEKTVFDWDFKHEYLFSAGWFNGTLKEKQDKLKEALKRSPLGISVSAWFQNPEGLYYRPGGTKDNHWVVLIGYEESKKWIIYDSSEQDIKELVWNFDFECAKVYYLYPVPPEEAKRRRKEKLTIMGKILELLAKILSLDWLLLKKKTEPEPIPEPKPKVSKLNDFCEAIKTYEGWSIGSRAYRLNNPGALKFTSLTKSLGATNKDLDNFCLFPDYNTGWNALTSFVKLAANNQLRDYKDCSILSFFWVYSDNSVRYASWVAQRIKESPDTKLKDFI